MADKIKLSKALKLKNRIVGEIQRIKNIISRENLKREDESRQVNSAVLLETQLKPKINELIELKSAIAKANIGIYEKIARMEEYKSLITYWERFDCDPSYDNSYENGLTVQHKKLPAIDRLFVDELIVEYKRKIESLQDEIDEYNAVTYI